MRDMDRHDSRACDDDAEPGAGGGTAEGGSSAGPSEVAGLTERPADGRVGGMLRSLSLGTMSSEAAGGMERGQKGRGGRGESHGSGRASCERATGGDVVESFLSAPSPCERDWQPDVSLMASGRGRQGASAAALPACFHDTADGHLDSAVPVTLHWRLTEGPALPPPLPPLAVALGGATRHASPSPTAPSSRTPSAPSSVSGRDPAHALPPVRARARTGRPSTAHRRALSEYAGDAVGELDTLTLLGSPPVGWHPLGTGMALEGAGRSQRVSDEGSGLRASEGESDGPWVTPAAERGRAEAREGSVTRVEGVRVRRTQRGFSDGHEEGPRAGGADGGLAVLGLGIDGRAPGQGRPPHLPPPLARRGLARGPRAALSQAEALDARGERGRQGALSCVEVGTGPSGHGAHSPVGAPCQREHPGPLPPLHGMGVRGGVRRSLGAPVESDGGAEEGDDDGRGNVGDSRSGVGARGMEGSQRPGTAEGGKQRRRSRRGVVSSSVDGALALVPDGGASGMQAAAGCGLGRGRPGAASPSPVRGSLRPIQQTQHGVPGPTWAGRLAGPLHLQLPARVTGTCAVDARERV